MNSHKNKIQLDPENARVHDSRSQQAIQQSLKDLGAGRSVLMDADNVLIGGNGVFAEAQALGLPVRIIDSDGSELIAIRRKDLKTTDAKRKALAIADNRCSDLSFFDEKKVAAMFQELEEYAHASAFTPDEIAQIRKEMDLQQEKIKKAEQDQQGEIPFGEELLEAHNYIVLYFTNEVDYLQAQTLFKMQTVKDRNCKEGYIRMGIGRVINGATALNAILTEAAQ